VSCEDVFEVFSDGKSELVNEGTPTDPETILEPVTVVPAAAADLFREI
jgi:hypothetical protein